MAIRVVDAVAVQGQKRVNLDAYGLSVIGGFHTLPEHGAPEGVASIAMLGMAREGWDVFAASPEANDGADDPMDRWSLRVVTALAGDVDAVPLFPFGGPPYQPFLRWAAATGTIWPSPIGMSIHAERGLWMSFRGALGFAEARDDLITAKDERPCESCTAKPCLTSCPVGAFTDGVYDVPLCVSHIETAEGADCLGQGCKARHACPVGRDWVPQPAQATFHMGAYLRARKSA